MENGNVWHQDMDKMLSTIEKAVEDTLKAIRNKFLPDKCPLNDKKFKENFLDAAAKR